MNRCVSCGKETEHVICNECRKSVDIEDLCNRLVEYKPNCEDNPNANPLWDEIASALDEGQTLRDIAYLLADELESPRREYQKIMAFCGDFYAVYKKNKPEFAELYELCIGKEGISESENYRLKGLMLEMLYSAYRYEEAEDLAQEILGLADLPWQTAYVLADYFDKTRRYDETEAILDFEMPKYEATSQAWKNFDKVSQSCQKHRTASETGKKEYIPAARENKEIYAAFMATIGIDVALASIAPKPIPADEYARSSFTDKADFDSFVAYDFETTGLKDYDAIIEVGAVKVINGQIVESEKFIFSEFVKPYKRSVSEKITEITGIRREDVANARNMWEVIPDFLDFAGDLPLVGYNNRTFDSKYLERAGRYSNRIINNVQLDVYQFLKAHKCELGYIESTCKLENASKWLGIENPAAHRAWADALTTARVYLKLKDMLK